MSELKDKKRNLRKKKTKLKKQSKPLGRPRHGDYLPFEEAAALVRKECLGSSMQYYEWWDRNRPSNLPRRPESPYKNEWKGWAYFIGKDNPFGSQNLARDVVRSGPKKYRSLEEIRKFAAMHGALNQEDWWSLAREGKLPDDIPSRPDIVFSGNKFKNRYKNYSGWVSWRHFFELSRNINTIEDKFEVARPILYISSSPSKVNGVYLINVIGGGVYELKAHLANLGVKLVRAFYTDINAEHKPILAKLNNYIYGQTDEYLIANVWDLISDLEEKLEQVRFD